MSKSFQNEIPKARVNIALDVETGGASKKKELPMKLLMLGDYSNGQAEGNLGDRDRVDVNKTNFNQVLCDLSPSINIAVDNTLTDAGGDLQVKLDIKDMNDFKPENVAEKIPQLSRLIAMRNLLKDLKASVIDNQAFRKELEAIMKDGSGIKELTAELQQSAPLEQE